MWHKKVSVNSDSGETMNIHSFTGGGQKAGDGMVSQVFGKLTIGGGS
jgi:hypothetical protein